MSKKRLVEIKDPFERLEWLRDNPGEYAWNKDVKEYLWLIQTNKTE